MLRLIEELEGLRATPDTPIREVMARMDRAALGIVLLIDADGRLLATITDGDVRRLLLGGGDLSANAQGLLSARAGRAPVTGPASARKDQIRALLRLNQIRHLPLVDAEGRAVALAVLDAPGSVAADVEPRALIMAGGFGRRLGDLTADTPKPMLPVRGRPMMEWVVDQLVEADITEVFVSLHFLGDRIREHFGDGEAHGVRIRYLEEAEPLGTAGAVASVPPSQRPLLVLNADILCAADLSAMVQFHRDEGAAMTMAVRRHQLQVPFGVVDCEGLAVRRITEKPALPFLVNAGMYVLGAEACAAVPPLRRFDMTDLTELLLNAGRPISAYPISEDWMDIGRPDDYRGSGDFVERRTGADRRGPGRGGRRAGDVREAL